MSIGYELYLFIENYKWPLVFIIFILLLVNKRKKSDSKEKEQIKQKGNKLIHLALTNNVEAVKRFLERERSVYSGARASTGESVLEIAIINNNKYIIAYLIKFGAIPNPRDIKATNAGKNPEIIEMIQTGKHLRVIKEYETKIV